MKTSLALLLAFPLFAQPDLQLLGPSAVQDLTRFNVPGAALAIVRGTEVIFSRAYGVANVETGEALRSEMLFRLGSTTKMFTATALAGLAVEGKLDLEAPIGKYIQGLPPKISQITTNQLLSHTAGILDESPMYGLHDESALGKGIRGWTDDRLFTAPGRIFSYSNPGYWLAGYLLETITGKPYADAMNELVFEPLGMKRTTVRPLVAMTWPLATGHNEAAGNKCTVARPAADNAATWPAGSIYSSTGEIARFVIALLNDGMLEGKRVLDPKVIALLTTPHARYPESTTAYGYGLELTERRGVQLWEHGGARLGYGTFIRMSPKLGIGMIVLTNRTGGNLPTTIERASDLLLASVDPPPATPIRALPTTPKELGLHTGMYHNGGQTLLILEHDGNLYLRQGFAPEAVLVKVSERTYAIGSVGGPRLVMVPGADGGTEFVSGGSRAYKRVRLR